MLHELPCVDSMPSSAAACSYLTLYSSKSSLWSTA